MRNIANTMTAIRKENALLLEKKINEQLTELEMKNASFLVSILPEDEFNKNGLDKVEFLVSTNIGDDFKPLTKIASGGEISRIMLAIKVVLSDLDHKFLFEDVYQELAFPLENLQYSKEAIQNSIAKLSQELEMEDLLDKKINDLTKEEQQILFFAIALLHKPRILILDQPFSMMNKDRHQKLLNYLKQLNKRDHTTIVLATSNLEDCLMFLLIIK